MRRTLVIVGGSVGGVRTAQAARARGYDGRIVLYEDESILPYDKPAMSKGIATGVDPIESLTLISEAELADLDIDYRPGTRVHRLDPGGRTVTPSNGPPERFTELVIATGSRPRRLSALEGLDGVHYLRTLADAVAIRDHFRHAPAVVVVGGGFIGAELASSAAGLGLEVTVVEAGPQMFGRSFPAAIADRLTALHRDHGVSVRTGRTVVQCLGDRAVGAIELENGDRLRAECVIIGVGSVPVTDWLDSSGLAVADGVVCDSGLQAQVDGIYAIGDAARWYHPRYGRHVRMEHWTAAREHAGVVARRLTGNHRAVCANVPYVWSDQYGRRIQHAGTSTADVTEHAVTSQSTLFCYQKGDRLVGVTGVDAQHHVLNARRLLATPHARMDELLTAS